ncbi:hypothetical protein B0H17DRAFT_1092240 [Mycena rosella]|uniref:Uncharacterized protein n=1 Tax=Mycena rosella TaxID=1033263 RepID=A0AAD7CU51_MYCRO|nr:hypothetical protein B0H17DRAFT_1092240 [Mycena rosella]
MLADARRGVRRRRRSMWCKENRRTRSVGAEGRPSSSTFAWGHHRLAHRRPQRPRVGVRHTPFFSRSASSSSPTPPARVRTQRPSPRCLPSKSTKRSMHVRPSSSCPPTPYALRPILICADSRPPRPCTCSGCKARRTSWVAFVHGVQRGSTWPTGARRMGIASGGIEGTISGMFIASVSFLL